MSGVFVNVNRGKRSVVLDLRTDEGKAALRALIEPAPTSSSTRCGPRRSPSSASATTTSPRINPPIVYTNCYGYGRRGPDGDLPAYDDTIQAECGLPAVQQHADRRGQLRRHDHGRQGRGPDRAVRHHDGAVPPRAHRRGPGGRGRHVRDDGVVHARRACQRRDVRPAARPRHLSARGGAATASRTARRTATSPR